MRLDWNGRPSGPDFPGRIIETCEIMSLFKDLRMDCLWADLHEHIVGGSWMDRIFVGVDVGKEVHWACVLDRDGHVLLSRKLSNDEDDITLLLSEVASLGSPENTTWTVDLIAVEASLLLAILFDHHHIVQYLPGSAVNRASAGYRGEGKTDAKDARVIADQSRMRRDLTRLQADDTVVREMRMLITRRNDVVADRIRTISQLRQQLTAVCPALERVSKIAEHHGWAIFLSRYQRPKALRRAGVSRLTSLLTTHGLGLARRRRSRPQQSKPRRLRRFACRPKNSPPNWSRTWRGTCCASTRSWSSWTENRKPIPQTPTRRNRGQYAGHGTASRCGVPGGNRHHRGIRLPRPPGLLRGVGAGAPIPGKPLGGIIARTATTGNYGG